MKMLIKDIEKLTIVIVSRMTNNSDVATWRVARGIYRIARCCNFPIFTRRPIRIDRSIDRSHRAKNETGI